MIRDAIARHLGGSETAAPQPAPLFRAHASHALLPLHRGGDEDEGLCLIEPAVRCNNCGYCLSYGH